MSVGDSISDKDDVKVSVWPMVIVLVEVLNSDKDVSFLPPVLVLLADFVEVSRSLVFVLLVYFTIVGVVISDKDEFSMVSFRSPVTLLNEDGRVSLWPPVLLSVLSISFKNVSVKVSSSPVVVVLLKVVDISVRVSLTVVEFCTFVKLVLVSFVVWLSVVDLVLNIVPLRRIGEEFFVFVGSSGENVENVLFLLSLEVDGPRTEADVTGRLFVELMKF